MPAMLSVGDTILNWLLNNAPMIAVFLCMVTFAVWVTIRVVNHQYRVLKLEEQSKALKKDVKSLKRSIVRVDSKVDRVERKLDRLITYLTATNKLNFGTDRLFQREFCFRSPFYYICSL